MNMNINLKIFHVICKALLKVNDSYHTNVSHTSAIRYMTILPITSIFCGAHNIDLFLCVDQERVQKDQLFTCCQLSPKNEI